MANEMVGPGAAGAMTLLNAGQAAFAAVYAMQINDRVKDARYERKKAKKASKEVIKYLESDDAQAEFDPSELAKLLRTANSAENRRERAQNEAIDAAMKGTVVQAAAAAGRTVIEMNGQPGYMDGTVFVPLLAGFAGFALAKAWDDDDDRDDEDDED